ncbi:hypothetical protein SLS55_002729 [Diplodia seriata]|uniref:Trichothecene 3-O-acetyltransferase-like N-terminal domain-containing protein n=1 Tax=Diplodia seriata TaxID=420778 RepID=A0ABR3CT00_9PEZI
MFFRSSAPSNKTFNLKASKPFDATFDLTLADNIPPAINSRYIFIYDTRGETGNPQVYRDELVDRLKKSLESFLRLPDDAALAFPQLLGKVHARPDNGRLFVRVKKDSSVPFVVATHDKITLESLRPDLGFPSRYLDPKVFSAGVEAVPRPDSDGGCDTFSVQVTFITGGYVLMVNKHHYLLDATATGFMMKSWFERARLYAQRGSIASSDTRLAVEKEGKATTIHNNTSLALATTTSPQDAAAPAVDLSLEWTVKPGAGPHIFGLPLPPASVMYVARALAFARPKVDTAIFHLRPAALKRLHADLQAATPLRISTHDAACALLWHAIARARLHAAAKSDTPQTCRFALAVNGRSKLQPPLAAGYFGNAAFFSTTALGPDAFLAAGATTSSRSSSTTSSSSSSSSASSAPAHDAATKSLAAAAAAIRANLTTKTTPSFLRAQLALVGAQPRASDVVNPWTCFAGHDVVATSWEKSFGGIGDVELGCGAFRRMRLPGGGQFDGLVCVLPAFGLRDVEGDQGEGSGGQGSLVDPTDTSPREAIARAFDGAGNLLYPDEESSYHRILSNYLDRARHNEDGYREIGIRWLLLWPEMRDRLTRRRNFRRGARIAKALYEDTFTDDSATPTIHAPVIHDISDGVIAAVEHARRLLRSGAGRDDASVFNAFRAVVAADADAIMRLTRAQRAADEGWRLSGTGTAGGPDGWTWENVSRFRYIMHESRAPLRRWAASLPEIGRVLRMRAGQLDGKTWRALLLQICEGEEGEVPEDSEYSEGYQDSEGYEDSDGWDSEESVDIYLG